MIPLAPSQAAVNHQAHSATAAAGTECVSSGFATACFKRHGDRFTLYNESDQTDNVASLNWSNYLRTRSGTWKYYRKGRFANLFLRTSRGTNRDLYEDQSVNAYGGKGSGIRLNACATGKGCSRYIWIRNSE